MAVSAQELNSRRAATLLRCQKVREQRRRRDAMLADHACAAAERAEREALHAREAGLLAGAERLKQAYDGLAGQLSSLGDLAALPALQAAIAREDEGRVRAVAEAEAAAQAARGVADAARAALTAESRATERRSKLATRALTLWRRTVDAAEEMERDEQVADTWRAV